MNFHVLTLFPEMIVNGLDISILGRAIKNGHISLDVLNIRDFANNSYGQVDDYPYGGGAGMVMQAEPIYNAYIHVMNKIENKGNIQDFNEVSNKASNEVNNEMAKRKQPKVIHMTPQGKPFTQKMAKALSEEDDLIFLCGHYEGIDERVLELIVTDDVSIGDYVLTGGELPAMVVIDAISRLVPGVLHNDDSAIYESFQNNRLEYPQYTRPDTFMDKRVPDVLLSGHHANIQKWREEQSVKRTKERRPDLMDLI